MSAQNTNVFDKQVAKKFEKPLTRVVKLDYLLYLPKGYEKSKKDYPMILFLHGAGERGSDINIVKKTGLPERISKERKDFPFIIVSPQCPKDDWWTSEFNILGLNALVDEISDTYRVDKKRIYLTGLSMGGFGSWELAAKYPTKFAAVAPICGGGNPRNAKIIKDIPIWVFHGAKDSVVNISKSQEMVDALKKVGSDVKFTIYPEANHNSWTETYNNPELYTWFLQYTNSAGIK